MNRASGISAMLSLLVLTICACASLERGAHVPPPEAPQSAGEYLARGMSRVDAAQKFRVERSSIPVMGGFFGWPPDSEVYLEHYARAQEDFRTVLARFPESPSAPEAQFLLGLINDHPHLNNFQRALEAYRLTIDRYPGTPAADKAKERKSVIEKIME